jgi:hypothetical protein
MPGDARHVREALAQRGRERVDPVADGVEAHRERVVDRHAEADLARLVGLPILEAARVGADAVGAVVEPLGGVDVEERGLEALDQLTPDIEEPGAARPAQELAPGGAEDVAADLADVDRHLADRLAGVEQERHAGRARDAADRGGGVDEAAVRGDVDERDQFDALVEHPLERVDIDLAGGVVGDALDHRAGAVGDLA